MDSFLSISSSKSNANCPTSKPMLTDLCQKRLRFVRFHLKKKLKLVQVFNKEERVKLRPFANHKTQNQNSSVIQLVDSSFAGRRHRSCRRRPSPSLPSSSPSSNLIFSLASRTGLLLLSPISSSTPLITVLVDIFNLLLLSPISSLLSKSHHCFVLLVDIFYNYYLNC